MRTADKQVLDAAMAYVSKGLPVFPVHFPVDDGCSCGVKSCSNIGKHPSISGGHNNATLEEAQVDRWFGEKGKYRGYNIAVVCGTGFACLDVDPKNKGMESFEALIRDHKRLPDTWVEETGEDKDGNRGLHYWFLIPPGVTLRTRKPIPHYPGVDLLATTGVYAVVAPSIHRSGVQYDSVTSIDDVVTIPEWLMELAPAEIEDEDVTISGRSLAEPTGIRPGPDVRKFLKRGGVDPGGQRAMACKASRALWGIWASPQEAADLIWEALRKCTWEGEPWTENQVLRLVVDEYEKQPKALEAPGGVALPTDVGRAYRLRSFARGNIRHCGGTGSWYVWDSSAWRASGDSEPRALVHEMSRVEYATGLLGEGDNASDIRKEALKIQGTRSISNCLTEAQAMDGVKIRYSKFDSDPMLLNCSNCVVDLRTGATREQRREDYMTMTTAFPYYKNATSDLWDDVIDSACSGDEELIDFLQLAFGYAATGDTREDAFFYFHGPGGSGKTTVLEAVKYVLGGYASAADPETFMLSQAAVGVSHRADLAALRGSRLVISTEIAQGSRFSASVLNRLTGRDTISARVPYAKAPVVFKPQWTLFFAANHFPRVPGATKRDGFWRRVKIFPFENRINQRDMKPNYPYLLATDEHGPGILRWVIEGAVRWWSEYGSRERTLDPPRKVTDEVASMQEQADVLAGFLQELVWGAQEKVHRTTLHQFYVGWAEHSGIRMPLSPEMFHPTFKASIEDTGARAGSPSIDGKQDRGYIGVGIPAIGRIT
jgi:P4 family phage/plasmid primase-like protien